MADFFFSETSDQIYVEWKIKNIFERCRKKSFFLKSPSFSVCCSKWNLMAYVRPKNNLPFAGWLDLYLKKETYSKEHRISCRIGVARDGVEVKGFNFECSSGSEGNTWGMSDFIELKENFDDQKDTETRTFNLSTTDFNSSTSRRRAIRYVKTEQCYQNVSSFSTANFTSDGSLTLFCTARLQDATTFPAPISSPNEIETFSKNIKDLYIDKRYTDVKIEVEDKEFLAHKCILAARSAVFASMFDHDMEEKSTGNVKITDCDPDSFQEFLVFLYSGKLDVVSSNNAISLYKTADKYNIEELMEECVRYMIRELSVDSFCDVLHFATVYDKTDLLTATRKFFNDNVKTILPTLKWHTFLEEHPSLGNELFIKFVDK